MKTIFEIAKEAKECPELKRSRLELYKKNRDSRLGLDKKYMSLKNRWYRISAIKIEEAIKSVLESEFVTTEIISEKYRDKNICAIRDKIVWTAWKNTGFSSTILGRFFKRNRGSILNSIRNHQKRIKE